MQKTVVLLMKKVALIFSLILGITVLWRMDVRGKVKKPVTQDTYSDKEIVTSSPKNTKENPTQSPKQDKKVKSSRKLPNMQPYIKQNKDVIGYISIPKTNIEYPILIGSDNEYYLQHNIEKEKDVQGSIMADHVYKDTKIRDEFLRHTMVYGHSMRNKTMFSSICKYKEEEFFKSHPYIYFNNLKVMGKWKVFSVYVVDADKETIQREFPDDKEYKEYLDKIKKRSMYDVDVKLDAKSKVLTLCTCSYETDNSRAIVHAVLVNE